MKSELKRKLTWININQEQQYREKRFQWVSRIFVLATENNEILLIIQIKYKYYVNNSLLGSMEKTFFNQPLKDYRKTHDNIQKIVTPQGDGYTTGCFIDCPYFEKKYCKMIEIDLTKQQALDADPKNNRTN